MRRDRRRSGRRGATLVELLVALPILAVGLGAAAAFILSSSAHLAGGEARLHASIQGIAVMDSLRLMAGGTAVEMGAGGTPGVQGGAGDALPPSEGRRPVAHAEMRWRWDGCCVLEVELDGGHTAWGRPLREPSWVLRPGGERQGERHDAGPDPAGPWSDGSDVEEEP